MMDMSTNPISRKVGDITMKPPSRPLLMHATPPIIIQSAMRHPFVNPSIHPHPYLGNNNTANSPPFQVNQSTNETDMTNQNLII